MSIIYRQEKGAPLTAREMDDNFHELEDRIQKLEAQNPQFQMDTIVIEDDCIAIHDGAGQTISQAKLPFMGIRPRGIWRQENAYALNDLVNREEVTYICAQSHRPEAFNSSRWQPLIPYTK